MTRIGVFVCHCGLNIAGTVNVQRVVESVRSHPNVVFATDYRYMCSDPGQMLIRQAISEYGLDGIVVAACSPTMHESTFRKAAAAVGLNPYCVEIANIREQVAWPHQSEPEKATEKAIDTVVSIVEKVRHDEPLVPLTFPVTRRALVIGGGVAGLTAALEIANAGYPVIIVERSEHLGGHVAQLSHLYPNFDASDALLTPLIEAVTGHPLIQVLTNSVVTGWEGQAGNFTVTVRGLPSPVKVGAAILATGFNLYSQQHLPEYGGGRYPDVIDSLQFEAMLKAGEILRPSDGRVPQEVVWVQCAGSRDPVSHCSYCSKICCMYVAKQAALYRRAVPGGQAYVFYIDVRSQGRGYEEFVRQVMEEYEVIYLRGKVSKIVERNGALEVWGADTLSGQALHLNADLVVLALAAIPGTGSEVLARLMRVATDESGFFAEVHPKLRPVESFTAGIYLAGAAQFPKDIRESVAQAAGAAAKVLQLFARGEMVAEPTVATVDEELCAGCGRCVEVCPYDARTMHPWKMLATVNAALCQSCGACAVACPNKATTIKNLLPRQIMAMVEALL